MPIGNICNGISFRHDDSVLRSFSGAVTAYLWLYLILAGLCSLQQRPDILQQGHWSAGPGKFRSVPPPFIYLKITILTMTIHFPRSLCMCVWLWILWLRGSDIFFSAVFGIILFRGTTKDLILFRFTTERKDFPCQLEPDKSSQTSLFLHCPQWQSEQITSQASLSVKDTTGRKCIKNQDIYPLSNILFPEPMTHSVLGHFIIKSWKSKL